MGRVVRFPGKKGSKPPRGKRSSKAGLRAWRIHFDQVCKHLDAAVAMSVLLGVSRKSFLDCAGQCYSYWQHKHDDTDGPPATPGDAA